MDEMALPDPRPPGPPPALSPAPSSVVDSSPRATATTEPPYPAPPSSAPPHLAQPRSVTVAQRIGWRTGIALCILAFLAGLALMALVAVRFDASFGGPARSVATLTVPIGPSGQPPVLIVPGKAAATPSIELAALSGREAELGAKLAQLEARAEAVDQDSARASSYATRAEGLMIAFAARRALDRGLNLGFLEDQLSNRFGASQPRAVATILQAARNPVTLEDLRAGLDGVTPELMTGAGSGGWWPSFQREMSNLIVLRRAGTPSPLPVDRVAAARRLLEAGQVEAALAEVARTPGAAKAERWTNAARRYIGARTALDAVESAAILTHEATPPPAPITPAPLTPAPRADVPGLGSAPPNR